MFISHRLSRIAIAARPAPEPEPRLPLYRRPRPLPPPRKRSPTAEGLTASPHESFRDIRVIPVVLIAIFSLAVLKVAGLVIDGGYVFDYQPEATKRSWAADTFNFPSGSKVDPADITGSVAAKKEEPKPVVAAPEVAKSDGIVVYPDQNQPVSASERAILERLQSRRQELEARAREVDIRESLLKAAEKRIESKVEELKAVESRITAATGQKAETDAAASRASSRCMRA